MDLLQLLYRALETQFGIVIETNDPVTLRSRLYTVRRESADPLLQNIIISTSRADPATELWIIRRA